jgi:UPF0755 protein
MMRSTVRTVVISLFAVTLLAGGVFFWGLTALRAAGPLNGYARIVIPRGTSLTQVASQLHSSGIIRHPTLFILVARYKGATIKAGEFEFSSHMTASDVLQRLADGKTVVRRVTVPEGLSNRDVARLLENAAGLEGSISTQLAEGTLLPDTYHYSYGDSRDEIVKRMARAMGQVLRELWSRRVSGLPIKTPRAAVILASIVEKETAVASERPRIAAVFFNRLRKNMRLQSDPTVAFALARSDGSATVPLTRRDLQIDHPFNTYRYEGLPPGPISNPGRASLEAVLQPLETDELYFAADGSGGHAFARTLVEHNRNVARWRALQNPLKVD